MRHLFAYIKSFIDEVKALRELSEAIHEYEREAELHRHYLAQYEGECG